MIVRGNSIASVCCSPLLFGSAHLPFPPSSLTVSPFPPTLLSLPLRHYMTGGNCIEEPTDECAASPCEDSTLQFHRSKQLQLEHASHQHVCTDEGDGYTCACNPIWTGKNCEVPLHAKTSVSLFGCSEGNSLWKGVVTDVITTSCTLPKAPREPPGGCYLIADKIACNTFPACEWGASGNFGCNFKNFDPGVLGTNEAIDKLNAATKGYYIDVSFACLYSEAGLHKLLLLRESGECRMLPRYACASTGTAGERVYPDMPTTIQK